VRREQNRARRVRKVRKRLHNCVRFKQVDLNGSCTFPESIHWR
jgi:hypothetical protein